MLHDLKKHYLMISMHEHNQVATSNLLYALDFMPVSILMTEL